MDSSWITMTYITLANSTRYVAQTIISQSVIPGYNILSTWAAYNN